MTAARFDSRACSAPAGPLRHSMRAGPALSEIDTARAAQRHCMHGAREAKAAMVLIMCLCWGGGKRGDGR